MKLHEQNSQVTQKKIRRKFWENLFKICVGDPGPIVRDTVPDSFDSYCFVNFFMTFIMYRNRQKNIEKK